MSGEHNGNVILLGALGQTKSTGSTSVCSLMMRRNLRSRFLTAIFCPEGSSLALAAYASTGRDPGALKYSQHFIDDFKRRYGFLSRRFHLRRRKQDPARRDIVQWIEQITALLLEVPLERIVNCDEAMSRVVPGGLLTWAPIGEDGVSVHANTGEKEAITALARITATHDKVPLFLIAKGKTECIERSQLGAPDDCVLTHSPSGWTTLSTFHSYLDWLRQSYDDEPNRLILDYYSVHRSADTRDYAKALGIMLHFIPLGWTGMCNSCTGQFMSLLLCQP
jgi:hypothetical protein